LRVAPRGLRADGVGAKLIQASPASWPAPSERPLARWPHLWPDVPVTLRLCPDPALKRSLGVWDRYGRSQRPYQLLALCCRDRLGGNVNDDAPLDPPVVVLRADDRDGDGERPAVVGSVVDCPAPPVKESPALLPRADPCRVFGFGGHGRFLPSMNADHTRTLIARQDERCCSAVLIR
jgi:hypothetical protein